jgi:cyclophilin family peptidyl-prolyl cis-trans isomerase/HEAT repeat protein
LETDLHHHALAVRVRLALSARLGVRARLASSLLALGLAAAPALGQGQLRGTQPVPQQEPFLRRDTASRLLYAKILELEDTRQYTKALGEMLLRPHAGVRRRAAIAIGRIGDPAGVPPLLAQLAPDVERDANAVADAVFALGEIEHESAVPRLLELLADSKSPAIVRARSAEALGKIGANERAAAALGPARIAQIAAAVAAVLPPPDRDVVGDDLLVGTLGVTALLRLKQPAATPSLVAVLAGRSSTLRWQAANAVARLRVDAGAAPGMVAPLTSMLKASEPLERANAARALGVAKSKASLDAIVPLIDDPDDRVRASAVRALASLGDKRAATPLNAVGERLLADDLRYAADRLPGVPPAQNLLLVVAEALGALKDPSSLPLLQRMRALDGHAGANPETELAVAAYGEAAFFDIPTTAAVTAEWHHVANYAQGLAIVGGERATREALDLLAGRRLGAVDPRAVPDLLTALGKLKPAGVEQILIDNLGAQDAVVRATAAQLLGELFAPSQSELSYRALEAALKAAAADTDVDARLALLESIAKYTKRQHTVDLLSASLSDPAFVVRRRAAELLEADGAGAFVWKLGPIATGRKAADYERIEARMRRPNPIAVMSTEKGDVRLELFVRDAPLTVLNFVDLARKKFFDGTVFHRVVPNFVVQGGDPRGDGNGGPGYQIRCEINEDPYDRGAVGMALSGKDTGGSQFFFTHAPQPHLDGGYTVFGHVTAGMDVVDRLARGDKILSVTIQEAD